MAIRRDVKRGKQCDCAFREDGSVSVIWASWSWKERLYNLPVALVVNTFKRQKALLLEYVGDEVHDIFSTMELTASVTVNDEEPDMYKHATDALGDCFAIKAKYRI
jgi:hypothetical protein